VNQITRIRLCVSLSKTLWHLAQNLHTVWLSKTPLFNQIKPIFFIQLGPNHKKQVINFLVLSVWCSSQSNLEIKLILLQDLLKRLSRQFMYLISNTDPPRNLLRLKQELILHNSLEPHHCVGCDKNAALPDLLRVFVLQLG